MTYCDLQWPTKGHLLTWKWPLKTIDVKYNFLQIKRTHGFFIRKVHYIKRNKKNIVHNLYSSFNIKDFRLKTINYLINNLFHMNRGATNLSKNSYIFGRKLDKRYFEIDQQIARAFCASKSFKPPFASIQIK